VSNKSLQFCPHCGTGVGEYFREGEVRGSCCPTEVVYSKNYKEPMENINLTNPEVVVESKSALKRQATQRDAVFTSGKYSGYSHKQVLELDPDYIIVAYETHHDSDGISRECYRLAQISLDEEHAYEDTSLELLHQFHQEDEIEE